MYNLSFLLPICLYNFVHRLEELKGTGSQLIERDKEIQHLKQQLKEKEVESTKNAQALLNLQSVLEQIQAEQDSNTHSEIILLEKELNKTRQDNEKMKKELSELKV